MFSFVKIIYQENKRKTKTFKCYKCSKSDLVLFDVIETIFDKELIVMLVVAASKCLQLINFPWSISKECAALQYKIGVYSIHENSMRNSCINPFPPNKLEMQWKLRTGECMTDFTGTHKIDISNLWTTASHLQ